MRLRISSAILALLLAVTATADSWIWKDHVRTWRFANGLRVDAITDKISQYHAKQYIKIAKGSHVLAIINGVGFDTLAASPKESLFVGISNSGLPGTAAVVFDDEGRLLLFADHGIARFDYCSETITLERVWHGSEQKDIQFENGHGVGGISLIDCHGKRVNLMKTVSEAYSRGLGEYEEWKVRQESSKK